HHRRHRTAAEPGRDRIHPRWPDLPDRSHRRRRHAVPGVRRPHQWPWQLSGRAFHGRAAAGRRRPRAARLQSRLQPAVRLHRVRHLSAAAAREPARPGDSGRRDGLRQVAARMTAEAWFAGWLLPALLATTATAAAAGPPVPLLWKVSDADNSVYLLGSFHVLRADDHPLSPDVDAAFDDAESLLFEMAPEEIASPTLALRMGQAALREDGSTLSASLPPATVAKLPRWPQEKGGALSAAGLPPEPVARFEPGYGVLRVRRPDMAGLGLDPELGLDRYFGTRATQAGKPTAGLETADQQIAFLDGMDAGEQLQFLDEALDNSLEGNDELEQLHAAWRAGDADGLWNGLAAEMRQRFPDLYRHINVERNDAWLPMLEQRLQAPGEDDTLVVVGALHLLGEDGLVHKLRERGY